MAANPDLITYYEMVYWSTEDFPTPEKVKELFGLTDSEFKESLSEIIAPLRSRGLPAEKLEPPVKGKKPVPEDLLDPNFVLAVGLIVDTIDKRSRAAKLQAAGMSSAKWQALIKKKDHREYFEKRLNGAFGDIDHAAKLSLSRNVEAGDLQSIKYYMELTGKYRPDQELTLNLGVIIGRLMEILSAKLEPKLLAEIADDIDYMLNPQKELTA